MRQARPTPSLPGPHQACGGPWDELKNLKDDSESMMCHWKQRIDQVMTSCIVNVMSQVGAANVDVH
jgi:hypothetical protein